MERKVSRKRKPSKNWKENCGFIPSMYRFGPAREFWRAAIYGTAKPVLYVVTPRLKGQAENLQRKRPATRTAVFEGAGHALFVDEPARFNTLLDEFLAEFLR